MLIDQKFKEISNYLDKVKEELRKELKQAQPGNSTIGITCDEEITLNYIPTPNDEPIIPGIYKAIHFETTIEVISYNVVTGIVRVVACDGSEAGGSFEFISSKLFRMLFIDPRIRYKEKKLESLSVIDKKQV